MYIVRSGGYDDFTRHFHAAAFKDENCVLLLVLQTDARSDYCIATLTLKRKIKDFL